jgi:metal-dependent hydrolase (beta-lactamase superfamily II)
VVDWNINPTHVDIIVQTHQNTILQTIRNELHVLFVRSRFAKSKSVNNIETNTNTSNKEERNLVKRSTNICEDDEEVTKLIITDGYVNNIHLKKIAFDIGATTSIMSERIVREHNIPLNDTHIKIKVADGREAKVIGITDGLKVKIKNHKTKLKFIVISHNEYDILLGLDYFNKTGLGIFPKHRLLKFPDEEIELENYAFMCDSSCNMLESNNEQDVVAPEQLIEWSSKKTEIKPEIELSYDMKRQFNELIPLIEKCTAKSMEELNGGSRVGEFRIKLTEDKIIHNHSLLPCYTMSYSYSILNKLNKNSFSLKYFINSNIIIFF